MRQRFQIVAALNQDTVLGSSTDAAEEGQRDGNNQRTGAGNNQENQCSANPLNPFTTKSKRRYDSKDCSQNHNNRSIVTSEGGNEVFCGSLSAGCVLHEVDNLGNRGFTECFGNMNSQYAALVDAARQSFITLMNTSGNGFSSQRLGIQHRLTLKNNAIQRNLLAGLYNNHFTDRNSFRRNDRQFTISADSGSIGTNIHQISDGLSGALYRHFLEELSYLIEKHDCNGFRVFTNDKGTDSRQTHQEVFIKHTALDNIFGSSHHHITTEDNVSSDQKCQLHR